jgi:hypothetical protein
MYSERRSAWLRLGAAIADFQASTIGDPALGRTGEKAARTRDRVGARLVLGQPRAGSGSSSLFAYRSNIAFEQDKWLTRRWLCDRLVPACSAGRRRAGWGSHGQLTPHRVDED